MNVPCIVALLLCGTATDDEAERLPLTLGGVEAQDPVKGQKEGLSIGPVAGYLKARDADRGTWFGGVNLRLRFARIFAIEGSITAHTDSFQDGDIDVVQYPVQVSALLFPIPDSPIEPYGVFGAGWYYTRYEFDGPLSGLEDETDRDFAFHAGAGLQVELGPSFAVFADFRWVFLDEPGVDNGNLDEEEFDFGMVTIGGSFSF
ncbi:MAG TPA: outer membrane beta-barrel protein [Planctomycetota bacterium]